MHSERLDKLVRLGEQMRDLANELDLELVELFAGMALVESRKAHYQSFDGESSSNVILAPWSIAPDQTKAVRRPGRKRRLANASNVTELLAYKAIHS